MSEGIPTLEEALDRSAFTKYCMDLITTQAEEEYLDPAELEMFFQNRIWQVIQDVARRQVGMCAAICTQPIKYTDQQRTYFGALSQGFELLLHLGSDMMEEAKMEEDKILNEDSRGSDYYNDPVIATLNKMEI